MSLRIVEPTPIPALRDLPITQQLFLWSVRHVVCAAEDRRGVCPLVGQFFSDAGLPNMLDGITALLRTLSATAREGLTVNIPGGAQVLPDEALLLRDLFANGAAPRRAQALSSKLMRDGADAVSRKLQALAVQFEALEAMRGSCAQCAPTAVH